MFRNVGIVFRFEFLSILRKKSFLVTTIILSLLVVALIIVPTIISKNQDQDKPLPPDMLNDDYADQSASGEEMQEYLAELFSGSAYYLKDGAEQDSLLADAPFLSHFEKKYTSEEEMRTDLAEENISYGVVFSAADKFEILSTGQDLTEVYTFIEQSLEQSQRVTRLSELGLSPDQITENYGSLFYSKVQGNIIDINARESGNFIFGMAYMILIYMMVILYGTTVSTSVAREKDNRTMEVLIANTKSDYLIIGKTLASGIAGVLQVFVLVVVAFLCLAISGNNPDALAEMADFNLDASTILITIFFALAGYFFYLFIYAALGAMVSKVEDVNYAVTPLTFLFVAGYGITFSGLYAPSNIAFKIGSFIPFTSVLSMPVRSMLVHVPLWEILISAALMLVSIVIFSGLAIRIYRLGSLNYGNRMKFFPTLKLIFRGEGK